METIPNYFAKIEDENGQITQPNKDLDLLKAHHFVLGYEKRFPANLLGKIEVYYQDLYNIQMSFRWSNVDQRSSWFTLGIKDIFILFNHFYNCICFSCFYQVNNSACCNIPCNK